MGKRKSLSARSRFPLPAPRYACTFCICGSVMDRLTALAALSDPEWLDLLREFITTSAEPISGDTLAFWSCPNCGEMLVTAIF